MSKAQPIAFAEPALSPLIDHPLSKDRKLATAVSNGETEGLNEFLDRFYQPVYRYLWRASGNRLDAEDLTMHALLTAAKDIGRYRQECPLQGWVFRVAHRSLLRLRRKQALMRLFQERVPNPAIQEPPDDSLVVAEALDKLPLAQRTAFLLTKVEGLSVEEAATVLRIPASTVRTRCFHARQRLQNLLAPTYQENRYEPF